MATEKKRVIDIDTSAAEQAVKNLSQSVKEMSKNLGKIDSTAKKFQSALDNLTKSEQEVAKSAQELNTATETLNNSVGNGLTNASTQSGNSVKELRARLKELRTTLMETEAGTQEYNAALNEASTIQHQLREQMVLINNSAVDFGQAMSNITKVTQGVIGGLQSAKAVMNLFGIENKEVIESLKQMQNLMALTQALPAIDNGLKAFKRLTIQIQALTGATSAWGKALISTGIGAIVVALGMLANKFMQVRDSIKAANAELVEQAKLKYAEQLKEQNEELQNQINLRRELNQIKGISPIVTETENLADLKRSLIEAQNEVSRLNGLIYQHKRMEPASKLVSGYDKWETKLNELNEQLKEAQENVKNLTKQVKAQERLLEKTTITETAREEKKALDEAAEAAKKRAQEAAKASKVVAESYNYESEALENLIDILNKRSGISVGRDYFLDVVYYEEQLKTLKQIFAEFDKELAFIDEEIGKYAETKGQESYIKALERRKKEISKLQKTYQEMNDGFELMSKTLNTLNDEIYANFKKFDKEAEIVFGYVPQQVEEINKSFEQLRTQKRIDFQVSLSGDFKKDLKNYAQLEKDITQLTVDELQHRRAYLLSYLESVIKVSEEHLATLDQNSLEYAEARLKYQQELSEAQRLYFQTEAELLNLNKVGMENLASEWQQYIYKIQQSVYDLSDAIGKFQSIGGKTFGLDSMIESIGRIIPMLDEVVNKAEEDEKKIAQSVMAIGGVFLSGISSMLSTLADEQDKETEAGFEQAKNLETASAVINTLSGVVSAWSSALALPFPASVIVGSLMSGMMVGVGAANIKKIQSQQFGSANASSLGSANSNAVSNITAPVQYTQDIQGSDIEGLIKDQRVIVLESDISNVQRKVQVSEREATF